jgi:hypothetical protein
MGGHAPDSASDSRTVNFNYRRRHPVGKYWRQEMSGRPERFIRAFATSKMLKLLLI